MPSEDFLEKAGLKIPDASKWDAAENITDRVNGVNGSQAALRMFFAGCD